MANEWNVSYPLDHTLISDVPGEIRKLKDSCKDQLDIEHETPQDGDATGSEHSLGSAVPYEGTSTPTNRPDGSTALADNAIDRARTWWDTNFDPPLLKKWNGSAWVLHGNIGQHSNLDDDSNAMLKDHAYLANQDGFVSAVQASSASDKQLIGYIGTTNDPAGAGDRMAGVTSYAGSNKPMSILLVVASGFYFEITDESTNATSIYWHPMGTLVKPTDQD